MEVIVNKIIIFVLLTKTIIQGLTYKKFKFTVFNDGDNLFHPYKIMLDDWVVVINDTYLVPRWILILLSKSNNCKLVFMSDEEKVKPNSE